MFSLWSLAVIFCLVWFLVLLGLLCKPYWCHLWGTEQYSVWGKKPLALVPLYHWVEARESQSFTIAVEMSWWDHSLGPASGQGNKKVKSLFLPCWEITSLTCHKVWNRGWDGWDFAVATAVGKLDNQQRLCWWKSAWGSLLGLCWVSTFPVLWWEGTDWSFFLPPFFLFLSFFFFFLSFFMPNHFLWQVSPLPVQGVWERKKKKKNNNNNR